MHTYLIDAYVRIKDDICDIAKKLKINTMGVP